MSIERARELIHLLFFAKAERGIVQFFRYGFVGGFSAVIDIGTLYVCTSKLHIFYLTSAALAFVLGTIVNYCLSILWVFESSTQKTKEFSLFTLIGLGGLGLNELIIWIMVEKVGLHYLVAKLVSVCIVLVWSFTLRRMLFARLMKDSKASSS